MKKTYKNRLPKNMEASSINAKVVDGEIIVEVDMKERFQPKDGDFLVDKAYGIITIIYKGTGGNGEVISYAGLGSCYTTKETKTGWGYTKDFRLATTEEKSAFLERLEKECHKRWNAEEKCLEDIRWRAGYGCFYFYIDAYFCVSKEYDFGGFASSKRYEIGNYFRTEGAAQKVADQMKEILNNSKAE